MRNKFLKNIIIAFFPCLLLVSCDSAEQISNGFDHEVPKCIIKNDSITASRGEKIEIEIEVSDNIALNKMELSYGEWSLSNVIKLDNETTKKYTYTYELEIPQDAKAVTLVDGKEVGWQEVVYRNDGSSYYINQLYHKISFNATDVNLNVRNTTIYLKIK